jgi:acetolactate synthase-1/2/3 large subunit
MEEQIEPYVIEPGLYTPVAPAALSPEVTADIATALAGARKPLVVTSYLGSDPAAVGELVQLAEALAIPVIEASPSHVNFPDSHPMHHGYHWHTSTQNPLLAQADVILVADSDVPWIPAVNRPADDAVIYCVDSDPLKDQLPLWHVPARRFAAAASRVALAQINAFIRDNGLVDEDAVAARRAANKTIHDLQRAEWASQEQPRDGVITPQYLTACVRETLAGEEALFLVEAVTNSRAVSEHMRANLPGSLIGSGASSLGWAGGGAVGAKLAAPDRTVVCLVGDGCYLFGVPSVAQWVSRRYNAPALTVIYNNRGWRAPKNSTLAVYPDGAAATADDFNVSFEPAADLPGVAAAAGGAFAANVTDPAELPGVLADALAAVHGGRSAVVAAHLPGV